MAYQIGGGGVFFGTPSRDNFYNTTDYWRTGWVYLDGGDGDDWLYIDLDIMKYPKMLFSPLQINYMVNIEHLYGMDTGGNPVYFLTLLDLKYENHIVTLKDIQGFYGNDTDNYFIGSDLREVVIGNAGIDVLYGNGGNDELYGGYQFETYNLNGARFAPDSGDLISGGQGDDLIRGQGGNDELYGDEGADTIFGDEGDDVIVTDGLDVIDGGDGYDVVLFDSSVIGAVFDWNVISKNMKNVELFIGGTGNDTIVGDSADNNFSGNDGDDTILGKDGNDNLYGNNGNDTLNGGNGDDGLYGNGGTDTATYSDASAGVTVNLSVTTAQNTFGAGKDSLAGIENLIGSAFKDTLTGDAGNNVLNGGSGNDMLNGGAGDDTLIGGADDDVIDGGAGIDAAKYSDATAGVTVNLSITTPQNTIGAGKDTLISIENLTGSAFNDTLTGDTGNNVLDGGDGNDVLVGGAGNDTLIGGNGTDSAVYDAAASAVTVDLSLKTAQNTGGAGVDTLSGIENLYGSRYDDVFTGDGGANTLSGDWGNDRLSGGDGNDVLNGGVGDDNLDGGAGIDTATYIGAGRGVTVNLGLSVVQDTIGAGRDTIVNIENLAGSGFDDMLTGDGNANNIFGNSGNDILTGGKGNDTLTGASGADTFRFYQGDGLDRIMDFSLAQGDRIQLNAASFGLSPTAKISDYVFFGDKAPDASHGYFLVTQSGISWDADGAGGAAATQIIQSAVAAADLKMDMFTFF